MCHELVFSDIRVVKTASHVSFTLSKERQRVSPGCRFLLILAIMHGEWRLDSGQKPVARELRSSCVDDDSDHVTHHDDDSHQAALLR